MTSMVSSTPVSHHAVRKLSPFAKAPGNRRAEGPQELVFVNVGEEGRFPHRLSQRMTELETTSKDKARAQVCHEGRESPEYLACPSLGGPWASTIETARGTGAVTAVT